MYFSFFSLVLEDLCEKKGVEILTKIKDLETIVSQIKDEVSSGQLGERAPPQETAEALIAQCDTINEKLMVDE